MEIFDPDHGKEAGSGLMQEMECILRARRWQQEDAEKASLSRMHSSPSIGKETQRRGAVSEELGSILKARQKVLNDTSPSLHIISATNANPQANSAVSKELHSILKARQKVINDAAEVKENTQTQEQVLSTPKSGAKIPLASTPAGKGNCKDALSLAAPHSHKSDKDERHSGKSQPGSDRPTVWTLQEGQQDTIAAAVMQVLGMLAPVATVAVLMPTAAAVVAGAVPRLLTAEQHREHQSSAIGAESPDFTILEVGDSIWIPCSREVWREGVVTGMEATSSGGLVHVEVGSDESSKANEEIPLRSLKFHIRNDDLLNIADARAVQDLSLLSLLHEPAILRALQLRFDDGTVYTSCGPVLLAVNPFRYMPKLYDDQQLQAFAELVMGQPAPMPHIFDVARAAYEGVWHQAASQTVLVSGESGAGKTETTKFVMRFLASISSRRASAAEISATENEVLQSNPLLEALGNAKTVRNDNSSRFGKFMEIKFITPTDATCPRLAGAQMRTYLLEKSRVVGAQKGERSFHIFYQVLAALSEAQSAECQEANTFCVQLLQVLMDFDACQDQDSFHPRDFTYLAKSKAKRISGVDEVADFSRTLEAMRAFQISDAEICDVFLGILAVLHLGNIAFQAPASNAESSAVRRPNGTRDEATKGKRRCQDSVCALARVSKFIGLTPDDLEAALCTHAMKVANNTIIQKKSVAEASAGRDALARHLYGLIFNFVVHRVNDVLRESNQESGDEQPLPFVGILDIFGFELFEYNSFEQLCVNFTNELLQQYFNEVIFKHEAMLYERECVQWDVQEFPDNTAIVSLLSGEGKNLLSGVFPTLDEECRISSGTHESWCRKLGVQYRASKILRIVLVRKENFVIEHFAGPVEYNSKEFLAKNQDKLSIDILQCMQRSSKPFISELFLEHGRKFGVQTSSKDGSVSSAPRRVRAYSVSSEFRQQLQSLMQSIRSTTPHFVRCLKPNPESAAHVFNRCSVAEQLRSQGVLEAIRVSRAGYPLRLRHREGVLKYRQLAEVELRHVVASDMENGCTENAARDLFEGLKSFLPGLGSRSIQVGLTLIFFKREAAEVLNSALKQTQHESVVRIQARWRGNQCLCRYAVTRSAVILSQAAARGMIGRRYAANKRQLRAALRLQRVVRGYRCRLARYRSLHAIRVLQSWTRSRLQHAWFLKVRRLIIYFQRWYRCNVQGLIRAMGLRRRLTATLSLQRYWRGALGRRLCASLRHRQRIAATRISMAWCRWVLERVMERATHIRVSHENKPVDADGISENTVGDNPKICDKFDVYLSTDVNFYQTSKFEKLGRPGELLAAMRCLRRSSSTLAFESASLAHSCSELKHKVHAASILRKRYERSALRIQAHVRKFLNSRRYRACRTGSPAWNQVPPLTPQQLYEACTLVARLATKKCRRMGKWCSYTRLLAQSQSQITPALEEVMSDIALKALAVLPQVRECWGWSSKTSMQERSSALVRVLHTYLSNVGSATSGERVSPSSSNYANSVKLPVHTEGELIQMSRPELHSYVEFLSQTVEKAGLMPPTEEAQLIPWILKIQMMRLQSLSLLTSMCMGYARGEEDTSFVLLSYLNDDILEMGYVPWHECLKDISGLEALMADQVPQLTDALGKKLLHMVMAQVSLCCILPAFVGFLADEPLLALWQQLLARRCQACPHFPILSWLLGLLRYAEDDLVNFLKAKACDAPATQVSQAFCCYLQQVALALPDGWRPETSAPEKQLLKCWWRAQSSGRRGHP